MKRIIRILTVCAFAVYMTACSHDESVVWQIGEKNDSSAEFALGPDGYEDYLASDLGFEDGYFIVGKDDPAEKFSYVLPGLENLWAGSSGSSGYRPQWDNLLFTLKNVGEKERFSLIIDMLDCAPSGCVLKYEINGAQYGSLRLAGRSEESLVGNTDGLVSTEIRFDIDPGVIREGGNEIRLTVMEGSWFLFDDIRLVSDGRAGIAREGNIFVRNVAPADYQVGDCQPLLVDVEALEAGSKLEVLLGGKTIFSTVTEGKHHHVFEAPMPAVETPVDGTCRVKVDGRTVYKGTVLRSPCREVTPADYVDTRIGAAHSRWMIAPGPWMPMSMVKLSPDNQRQCWQGGYEPILESVGCFSHIHEWTMAGLGIMPTNGELFIRPGSEFDPESGYRSRINPLTEEAPIGHYRVQLTDTGIDAMVSATTRCSFHRYTFPADKPGRIMIDFHIPAEYGYILPEVNVRQVSEYRIEGFVHQLTPRPDVWADDCDQDYTLNFVIEFDRPVVKIGNWVEDKVSDEPFISAKNLRDAGMFVEFDTRESAVVQARIGISPVSVANAAENLEKEISEPFGWDIGKVAGAQKEAWNEIFGRAVITTSDRMEKVRFYTNMYRALCRNTWSDVNGDWVAPDETVRHFSNPDDRALGCDAFWNTFWNLNQFWNLFAPEWSSRWVRSQLALYDACGWIAKGPAGMEYIPVMVGEHEIPQMVGAWQMGIRDYDSSKLLEAVVKMQTTPGREVAGGFAGNRDLIPYLKYHYVPCDEGTFSNSLEYSYDDWAVSQLARSLGREEIYRIFSDRGSWWKNVICPSDGYAHLKSSSGEFLTDFDPFDGRGYTEGNAWQLTYFVPQDVPGLVSMLGEKDFVERLEWGFEASEPFRFNAPNEMYHEYPVVQGNQQSMHFAFLFNYAAHPWLTQKWSRSILDRYYGYGEGNAYLGDEDQGQMSAWFVMAAIGLFQTDGGCSSEPYYEIASPLYEKVEIDLGGRYGRGDKFVIEAHGVSAENKYVQSATLNGAPLNSFRFPASELLGGGSLVLEMGAEPNTAWGKE